MPVKISLRIARQSDKPNMVATIRLHGQEYFNGSKVEIRRDIFSQYALAHVRRVAAKMAKKYRVEFVDETIGVSKLWFK